MSENGCGKIFSREIHDALMEYILPDILMVLIKTFTFVDHISRPSCTFDSAHYWFVLKLIESEFRDYFS